MKYKCTYSKYQRKPIIKGKKVRFWKRVYYSDAEEGDEFIPIYYEKKSEMIENEK